jgi:hypothetical protein
MQRPAPRFPEPDTQPYWDATKEHRLVYGFCKACSAVVFYPRRVCKKCNSLDVELRDSKGEGVIYSYSVVRRNPMPHFREAGSYAVAFVDLDEGFRLLTAITGVADPVNDVKIGQRVRVAWEDQEEGHSVPVFELIS